MNQLLTYRSRRRRLSTTRMRLACVVLIVFVAGCAGYQTPLEKDRARLQSELWLQCMNDNFERTKAGFDAYVAGNACGDWARRRAKVWFRQAGVKAMPTT